MKKLDKLLKEWIGALGIAVIVVIVLSFLIWPMRVKGHSMEPTLTNRDLIFVSKVWTVFHPLKHGDLIVVNIEEAGKRQKIVKRIIGISGDHIVIKEGKVSINSKVLIENYVLSETLGDIDLFVPKDAYFLLGDNRKISKDSRLIGCIDQKSIRGKLVFRALDRE